MRRIGACLAVAAVLLAGCGGKSTSKSAKTVTIVVDAPFSRTPYVGNTIANGVRLAADQANARGVSAGGDTNYRIRVVRLDNALSPARAVANTRRAVRENAIAVVTDGTGINATWRLANDAKLPICLTYQGGEGLVDAQRRNVFRIAPTDHGLAFRLAEYLIPKGLKIALLTDDSDYGQEGRSALARAFASNRRSVAARITLPSSASDLAPQVLQARRAGATALLVWAQAPTLAKAVVAARASGWQVPVYTTPAGEDPILRQQLADHPSWVDGITFASGRMTAELGSAPWSAFQSAYESAYGATYVGVRTREGQRVIAPPDYAMYSYDFVNVLISALQRAGGTGRPKLLAALNEVSARGANGDERGFNERNHEGVIDDDVYFARFRDMTYRPVSDDPLSSTLPVIPQT